MEIKKVTVYKVEDELFDTEEEAKNYVKQLNFRNALTVVVYDFYHRGMDADDIVDGIIRNKDLLNTLLNES